MTNSGSDLNSLRQLYCTLMREIKLRVATLSLTLDGKNPFAAFAAFEFCFLQLRLICETLALACLAVHGDVPATRSGRFRKTYEADWIIKRLEQLHPEFYPVPCTITHVGSNFYREGPPSAEAHLSKRDLVSLYVRSGAVLHRGSISTIRAPLSTDFSKVLEHHNKIIHLLAQHKIHLNDGQTFLVTLASAQHNGEVFAVLGREARQETCP